MADRLVTIATFDGPTQAQMARGVLESAGIDAVLADENTVTLFWHLSNAVGGIKVQVREADAERAVAVLEEALGPDEEVDPEHLAAETEAAGPETEERTGQGAPATSPQAVPVPTPDEPAVPAPNSRDRYARGLVFVSWLGLGCPPVLFFALYFF